MRSSPRLLSRQDVSKPMPLEPADDESDSVTGCIRDDSLVGSHNDFPSAYYVTYLTIGRYFWGLQDERADIKG